KVVQTPHAHDCRGESCWDLRIAGVGPVLFSTDQVFVNCSVKCLFYLRFTAGKLDDSTSVGNTIDLEAVQLEPVRNYLHVLVGGAELLAEFIGSEPLVIGGRVFVLLVVEQSAKCVLLLGAAFEDQQHA